MKLAIAALCTMFVASAYGQSLQEMMLMSSLFGNRGSSSSNSNPLAALTGGSSSTSSTSLSSSNPLAALTNTVSSTNPLAAITGADASGRNNNNPMASLFGGNMGGVARGMMLGGAEMSNLMDFYTCGMWRLPPNMCFMMMQNNM